MVKSVLHTLFAVMVVAALTGCAVYPAVQVAGHAMTGYDAVTLADEYLPRKSVEGGNLRCATSDQVMQRRLRERLQLQRTGVRAHVVNAQAYLVGPVANRKQADKAIRIASTVQGLRTITCKFYHMPTQEQADEDVRLHTELSGRLKQIKHLETFDLRIEIVGANAILIGRADTFGQKTEALAVASEIGGLNQIIDYISVKEPLPDEQSATDTVASN